MLQPALQGDIGAAVSVNGGASFHHLGLVLDEPFHLSYPFVFEHNNTVSGSSRGSSSSSSTTTW